MHRGLGPVITKQLGTRTLISFFQLCWAEASLRVFSARTIRIANHTRFIICRPACDPTPSYNQLIGPQVSLGVRNLPERLKPGQVQVEFRRELSSSQELRRALAALSIPIHPTTKDDRR